MSYTVCYYDADGHDSSDCGARDLGLYETMRSAREAIWSAVGNHGRWTDDDGDECWHESDDEGCGGYTIVKV